MRIDFSEESKDINFSSFRLLPEFVKVMGGDEAHMMWMKKSDQFFRDMTHLTPFGKRKMDMGACNDQGFLIFPLFFFKLQGSVDLRMVYLCLSFTHHNLHSKRLLGIWNFNNSIYRLIVDPG